MPSSITRLVALDHERLIRLLRRARSAGPSQERWRDELVHLSRAHLAAVELTLAGAALEVDLRDLPQRAHLDLLIERVASGDLDREFTVRCDELGRALSDHYRLLHEQVLVPLEDSVPRKQIRLLGGAYDKARDGSLREQGDAEPPPRRLDLSRAELYELAKKAGIEGRSSMSRRELIERLLQREGTR